MGDGHSQENGCQMSSEFDISETIFNNRLIFHGKLET